MRNINDNFTNWIKMQDWFFDKILKKEEKILPGFRSLNRYGITTASFERQKEVSMIDYQDALFDASRSMIRFKKPRRLIKMIDRIINEKVGVTHSAVLIYDQNKRSYILMDSRGSDGKKIPAGYIRLDLKSALVEFFRKQKNNYFFENNVVNFRELSWMLESGQLLTKDAYLHNKLRSVLKEMELLDAEVCIPCFAKKEMLGILILGKKKSGRSFIHEEMNLFATLANDAAMALANARLIENLQGKVQEVEHLYEREHELFMNTAVALAKAMDARDIYTHGHTERVTTYCMSIANGLCDITEIEDDKRFKELLRMTALLHDIGKIGVPDKVLNKRGRLNAAERKIVEKHPEVGASILLPIRELNEIAMCVRSHQEWYNGNGYPDGLKRDEIPLIARIVSVADAFDAITSDRPYRKKRNSKEATVEIKEYSGTQFDPQIVEAFLEVRKRGQIDSNGK